MPRTREHSEPTRQIYASIREDIYLAAKSRAAQLRLPMRRFIEEALVDAVNGERLADYSPLGEKSQLHTKPATVWDDQYIGAQASQPLGSPLDLSLDEARRVILEGFSALNSGAELGTSGSRDISEEHTYGNVGDPVDFTEEDAARMAREAFEFGSIHEGNC